MSTKGTPANKYKFKTPPDMLKRSYELRLTAQFGDRKAKDKLAAYNRRRKERMLEAGNKEWFINGKNRNRYWVMESIVTEVSAGTSLKVICSDDQYPTMQQVYSWFKMHPDFKKAYEEAEEVRGHLLGEQALEIALKTDRENVQADKLKIETLSKFAARANTRFQDKQVTQNVDELATMSTEQIRARLQALYRANPELSASLGTSVLGCSEDVPRNEQPVLSCEIVDPDPPEPQSPDEDD